MQPSPIADTCRPLLPSSRCSMRPLSTPSRFGCGHPGNHIAVNRLAPGPDEGAIVQTVTLHRDPLGYLRAQQARYGDVFTLRLATVRPLVVVAAPDATESL